MLMKLIGVLVFSAVLLVLGTGVISAQDYPHKPIRIVTSPPGGGNDFVARLIAQGLLASPLGQPVIVDNRAALVAVETVSKAPPDGYTLLVASSSFVIGPLLRNLSYDPVRDFSPITKVGNAPNILVVHPSVPVKSVKELIALAKAKPGALDYASSGAGGAPHLLGGIF